MGNRVAVVIKEGRFVALPPGEGMMDAGGTKVGGAGDRRFESVSTDIINERIPDAGVTVEGVLVKDGLVVGRDVAVDGAKLDGIEMAATADQTGAEIKTAYEAEADTNAFTDAEQTKLAGIEAAATADQTGSEIKTAYEAEADTNAFTDAEQTKLAGIETSATADQTGAEIKTAYEGETDTNAYTDADKSKLAGIEASATADQTGAEIKTAYEGEADTNAFTDAEQTKLAGIEASATADQTGAEIKTAYEGEADTNAYTDADQTKLGNIEAAADVTDAVNVAAAGAVMDGDFAANGQMERTGAGSYTTILNKRDATVAPAASDDSGSGYAIGSSWIDVTNDKAYVCLDATASAAVWSETTAGAGGGISDLVDDTTPQLGGDLDANGHDINMGNGLVSSPEIKDYSSTLVDHGTVSTTSTVTLDYSAGNRHKITVSGTPTITVRTSNWPASGKGGEMHLIVEDGGLGTFVWELESGNNPPVWEDHNDPVLAYDGRNRIIMFSEDGGVTVDALKSGPLCATPSGLVDHGTISTTSTVTLDYTAGLRHKITASGSPTITVRTSNWPAGGKHGEMELTVENQGNAVFVWELESGNNRPSWKNGILPPCSEMSRSFIAMRSDDGGVTVNAEYSDGYWTLGETATVESVTSTSTAGSITTMTLTMPKVRPDGRVYVCIAAKDGTGNWSDIPSHFNEIYSDNSNNAGNRMGVWWWVGDNEPATYVFSHDAEASANVVYQIRGADLVSPIDEISASYKTSSQTVNAPSVTTTVDRSVVLWGATAEGGFASTPGIEDQEGYSAGCGYAMSHDEGPDPAGATGVGTFTLNGTDKDAFALAVAIK
ncbi:MAG: hypothetical protein HQL52_07580 [Magnetococcales bacterium]|nr:hypothetical protein [Magnetococcales bacterium]